jgi:hypothetical protein
MEVVVGLGEGAPTAKHERTSPPDWVTRLVSAVAVVAAVPTLPTWIEIVKATP